ncbi:prepilin peptidase [Zymobacter sp. IVIA_5232.4 C2]|uniref:prepilin peptidase n=1 Tax=Zymobacter sp. IVIA_5232.4 C2 TaxID=3394855 RepID=UPI0039C3D783
MSPETVLLLDVVMSAAISIVIAWPFRHRLKRSYVLIGLLLDAGLRYALLSLSHGSPTAWMTVLAFAAFSRLAWIDASTGRLPDALTLPLLAAGGLHAVLIGYPHWSNALLGACVGYLILFGIDRSWWALHKRHAIGGGDMKLLAALGAWSGIHTLLLLLSCACLMAASVGLATGRHHQRAATLPFGPFLVIAALLQQLLMRHWAPPLI